MVCEDHFVVGMCFPDHLGSLTSCMSSLHGTGLRQRLLISAMLPIKRPFICAVHLINPSCAVVMLMQREREKRVKERERQAEIMGRA